MRNEREAHSQFLEQSHGYRKVDTHLQRGSGRRIRLPFWRRVLRAIFRL